MPEAARPIAAFDSSALKDQLRDRLLRGMRDRQRDILHSQLRGEFPSLPVKGHGRPPSRHPRDFTIAPPHAMIPARAQRLHRSFLGGEARGVTLEAVSLGIAVANLSRREDALQKAVPKALNGLPDARNFSDVDARAYDHIGRSF